MEIDTEIEPEVDTGPAGWEYTVEDYVRIEAESELVKHEFDDGQIRAMGGGTNEHARMAMALGLQLGLQLEGRPCAIYSADGRVRIGGLITYPDLSIACAKTYLDLEDRNAQLNPCVLVEITSPSSERYDRGKKRLRYFKIPSLREYVIVSHTERAIDVYARDVGGRWNAPVRYGLGTRALVPSLSLEIDVDKLYTNPMEVEAYYAEPLDADDDDGDDAD